MTWKNRIDTQPAPWGSVPPCPLPASAYRARGGVVTASDRQALARWNAIRAAAAFAEARRVKRLGRGLDTDVRVIRAHGERLSMLARAQRQGLATHEVRR